MYLSIPLNPPHPLKKCLIEDCRLIPFVIARLLVSRGDPGGCEYVTGIPLDCRSRLRLLRNDKKNNPIDNRKAAIKNRWHE